MKSSGSSTFVARHKARRKCTWGRAWWCGRKPRTPPSQQKNKGMREEIWRWQDHGCSGSSGAHIVLQQASGPGPAGLALVPGDACEEKRFLAGGQLGAVEGQVTVCWPARGLVTAPVRRTMAHFSQSLGANPRSCGFHPAGQLPGP